MPKKKGKKPPSGGGGGCNSAICQVLGVNFTAAQNFGWTLVLEMPDVSGQFPITAVDLSACQVSVQRPFGTVILSCKEIENFISYEVRKNGGASGNDVAGSCNVICDLLNYNLQQETANGWGNAQAFTIELIGTPSVELQSVNLGTCEVTVDTAPTTRNCTTIANTWNAFQVHQ
ncbi:hypothetical protein M3690_26870 [Priestia megaterium]|uniref:hypothetical protein n=1 Tax=Priestia TaxID=2800373 RepID=UPI001E3774B7|nr:MULTISPECIES: hypothetical protein [Priestia]MCM3796888.1 hypothetical protein [Priestia megaterium]